MTTSLDTRSVLAGILVGTIVGAAGYAQLDGSASDNTVEYLAPYYFSDNIPGYVTGEGSWVMKGEELANKYNSVSVSCFNDYGDMPLDTVKRLGGDAEMYCYVAQGDILDGYMAANLTVFTVTEWNEERVVAVSEGGCRKVTMTLDRASETVTQQAVLINTDPPLCSELSPEPVLSYLTNGLKVTNPEI